jgi:hypothetical protein
MDAVEYLKNKARMCEENTCHECGLTFDDWDSKSPCLDTERDYPEKAVEIVEKWAKENPVKTYLSVLLEKFPNAKLNEKGLPTIICPNMIFRVENGCGNGQFMTCLECWNREYKEEE